MPGGNVMGGVPFLGVYLSVEPMIFTPVHPIMGFHQAVTYSKESYPPAGDKPKGDACIKETTSPIESLPRDETFLSDSTGHVIGFHPRGCIITYFS